MSCRPRPGTPLLALDAPFRGRGWFQLEYLQHPGTFKARGAFNRILRASENDSLDPSVRVVVASGGDAGMATRLRLASRGYFHHRNRVRQGSVFKRGGFDRGSVFTRR